MHRRDSLKLITGTIITACAPAPAFGTWVGKGIGQATAQKHFSLNPADDAFLDDMQRRAVLFFLEQSGTDSGQVLDRAAANNTTGQRDPRIMASIAATGFGLSALCIADKRAYHPHAQLVAQVRKTLDFHLHHMPHDHGFLYHFNHIDTGEPYRDSEVSSIDTALFLCGVLTARAHFRNDPTIVSLATQLYERVDWPYMLDDGPTLSMGLRKGKFIDARWQHYCELMMIYLLGLGSPTHPLAPATWDAWSRPTMTYDGFTYISSADPLFTHQYSHAWFDFRNKRDKYTDYFANSITATRAHKAFCLDQGKPYTDDYWGISASDSAHGYTAWGGPAFPGGNPHGFGGVDGSVVPNATAGSLPFLPAECLRVQLALKATYGDRAWGRYGFCDAFHPQAGWYDPDVLGIDLGISVIMSENLRSSFIWNTFQRNPEVAVAMQKAGFHPASA